MCHLLRLCWQHPLRLLHSMPARSQVIENAVAAVKHLRSLGCNDIEFSPEDAGRSDPEFLYQVSLDNMPMHRVSALWCGAWHLCVTGHEPIEPLRMMPADTLSCCSKQGTTVS